MRILYVVVGNNIIIIQWKLFMTKSRQQRIIEQIVVDWDMWLVHCFRTYYANIQIVCFLVSVVYSDIPICSLLLWVPTMRYAIHTTKKTVVEAFLLYVVYVHGNKNKFVLYGRQTCHNNHITTFIQLSQPPQPQPPPRVKLCPNRFSSTSCMCGLIKLSAHIRHGGGGVRGRRRRSFLGGVIKSTEEIRMDRTTRSSSRDK